MLNRFAKVLVATLFALAGYVVTAGPAVADGTAPPATSLGYDISFPQCGGNLPTPVGFGIVGANDGHPFSTNPCLVPELRWAAATESATPEFYTNTANPGPAGDVNWPTGQQSPDACSGANNVSCSYDFGWNAARGSLQAATAAEASIGATSPLLAATQAPWWLDVESGNAWQSIRTGTAPTSAAFANDDAVISGELAYFASANVGSVGIYSTTSQWRGLMGDTGTLFAPTKVWLPGYANLTQAEAACGSTSFTGGRVAMIQYPSLGLDGDYLCPLIVGPVAAAASVAAAATFSDQFVLGGQSVGATYLENTGAPDLLVSGSGLITTNGQLPAGTYTTTGTVLSGGDSGPFTFTLVVGALTQIPPTAAPASVTGAANFHAQLVSTGASVPVVYTKTSGASGLLVSPSGVVSTDGSLTRGLYVARGTTTDVSGDRGRFIFFLRVGELVQRSLVKISTTAPMSAGVEDQLAFTGGSGQLTYNQVVGGPALVVSPSGLLTTVDALVPGTYVARGTVSDAGGDRGAFVVVLTVTPAGRLIQALPTRAAVGVLSSGAFTTQLAETNAVGAVSFAQSAGAPALLVSSTGLLTTNGALVPGSYVARGSTIDADGNRGTFFFNLVVQAPGTLTQSSPSRVSTLAPATFQSQLAVTGAVGAVTFTQSTGTPDLQVSTAGLLTVDGVLPAGSYVTRGTVTDAQGDHGTFFFNLEVQAPGTLAQSSPIRAATQLPATFQSQLTVTGAVGAPTFTQSTGSPNLRVSANGLLTTNGALAPGSYVARGTVTDDRGDRGAFFFDLVVRAAPSRPVLEARQVRGVAVAGQTVTLQILGTGFEGRPTVTSHAGTVALVVADSGTTLVVRVSVLAGSRSGSFTFTITLANGATCKVGYLQR